MDISDNELDVLNLFVTCGITKSYPFALKHIFSFWCQTKPPRCSSSAFNHLIKLCWANLSVARNISCLESSYQKVVKLFVLLISWVDGLLHKVNKLLFGDVISFSCQDILRNVVEFAVTKNHISVVRQNQ